MGCLFVGAVLGFVCVSTFCFECVLGGGEVMDMLAKGVGVFPPSCFGRFKGGGDVVSSLGFMSIWWPLPL